MLKKFLTKTGLILALASFLVQAQWFETGSKAIAETHAASHKKGNKQNNFTFDQNEEDSEHSDDSASSFLETTYRISEFTYTFVYSFVDKINSEHDAAHHLQERPLWLTLLKIIQ